MEDSREDALVLCPSRAVVSVGRTPHSAVLTERGATATYWLLDHATLGIAAVPLPGGAIHQNRLDIPDGKAAWVGGPAKAALLAASREDQRKMLDALAEGAGCSLPHDRASGLYLQPDEWATLQSNGMRVGAHSVNHPCDWSLGPWRSRTRMGTSTST